MKRSFRIVVADDERNMSEYLQEVLPLHGHEVIGVAETGRELLEQVRRLGPDLVIADIKMPDMDGIDAAIEIYREKPVPIILISAHYSPELIERAQADHVMAYLVKPINAAELGPTISIAAARFDQFQAVRQEAVSLRQALADRKVIERAKGILMKKAGLDEQDAFRRLQKMASDRGRKMVDIADMILTMEDLFAPPERIAQ
jgi:response regulator NasT